MPLGLIYGCQGPSRSLVATKAPSALSPVDRKVTVQNPGLPIRMVWRCKPEKLDTMTTQESILIDLSDGVAMRAGTSDLARASYFDSIQA